MPTTSQKQKTHNTAHSRAIVESMRREGLTDRQIAERIKIPSIYISSLMEKGILYLRLWQALKRADLASDPPRVQRSFLVPLNDVEAARRKFAEHYPDVVLIQEWRQS